MHIFKKISQFFTRLLKRPSTGSNATQVYVGNIHYGVQKTELYKIFGQFGHIEVLKLVKNKKHERMVAKGFAFITYTQATAAANALTMHGTMLQGRKLIVAYAKNASRS